MCRQGVWGQMVEGRGKRERESGGRGSEKMEKIGIEEGGIGEEVI